MSWFYAMHMPRRGEVNPIGSHDAFRQVETRKSIKLQGSSRANKSTVASHHSVPYLSSQPIRGGVPHHFLQKDAASCRGMHPPYSSRHGAEGDAIISHLQPSHMHPCLHGDQRQCDGHGISGHRGTYSDDI